MQATAYDACMDVIGSDHKPVTTSAPKSLSSKSCCWAVTQGRADLTPWHAFMYVLQLQKPDLSSCDFYRSLPKFLIRVLCPQVWALLAVDIPVTQQERRRTLCSDLLRRCFAAHAPARPRLELSADRINLHQVSQPSLHACFHDAESWHDWSMSSHLR